MKILILGAGKMCSFFCDLLSFDHEVAVYDPDQRRLRFTYNVERFASPEEIAAFAPELVINAATVKYTLDAFHAVLPYLPQNLSLIHIFWFTPTLEKGIAKILCDTVELADRNNVTAETLKRVAAILDGDAHGSRYFRTFLKDTLSGYLAASASKIGKG